MAGIPTSPTVVFIEKDNSAYPPNINSSIVGIVGYASKGPTDEATLITSQENFYLVFLFRQKFQIFLLIAPFNVFKLQ